MTRNPQNIPTSGRQCSSALSSERDSFDHIMVTPPRPPRSSGVPGARRRARETNSPASPPFASPTSVVGIHSMETKISSPLKEAVRCATTSTKKVLGKVKNSIQRATRSPNRRMSDPFQATYRALDDRSTNKVDGLPYGNEMQLTRSCSFTDGIMVDSADRGDEQDQVEEENRPKSEEIQSPVMPRQKRRNSKRDVPSEADELSEGTFEFNDSLYNDSLSLDRGEDIERHDNWLPTDVGTPIIITDVPNDPNAHVRPKYMQSLRKETLPPAEHLGSTLRAVKGVSCVEGEKADNALDLATNDDSMNRHVRLDSSQPFSRESLRDDAKHDEGPTKVPLQKACRSVKKVATGSRYNKINLDDSTRTDRCQYLDDDSYQQSFSIASAMKSAAVMQSCSVAHDSEPMQQWKEAPSRLPRRLSLSERRHGESVDFAGAYEGRPRRSSRRLSLPDGSDRNKLMESWPRPSKNLSCELRRNASRQAVKKSVIDGSDSAPNASKTARRTSYPCKQRTDKLSSNLKGVELRIAPWEALCQAHIQLGTPSPRPRGSRSRRTEYAPKSTSPREKSDPPCSPLEHEEFEGQKGTFATSPRLVGPSRKVSARYRRHSHHSTTGGSSSPRSAPKPREEESCLTNTKSPRRSSRRLSTRSRNQFEVEPTTSPETSDEFKPRSGAASIEHEHEDIQSSVAVTSTHLPRRRASLAVFEW